jgi:hypothetical protein
VGAGAGKRSKFKNLMRSTRTAKAKTKVLLDGADPDSSSAPQHDLPRFLKKTFVPTQTLVVEDARGETKPRWWAWSCLGHCPR